MSGRIWLTAVITGLTAIVMAVAKPATLPAANSTPNVLVAQTEPAIKLNERNRRRVQRALKALGFDVGEIDGRFRRQTRTAIKGYQAGRGEPATGRLTARQLKNLLATARSATPKPTPSNAAPESYSTSAVHGRLQRIFQNYQPAAPLGDVPSSAKAFAQDQAIADDVLSLPGGDAYDINEDVFSANPKHNATSRATPNVVTGNRHFETELRAIVSSEHRSALRALAAARKDRYALTAQEARAAAPNFEAALADVRAQYGRSHPLVGFVLSDFASITQQVYESDDQIDAARKLAQKRYLEAARLLSQPIAGSHKTRRAVSEHAARNYLRANDRAQCGYGAPERWGYGIKSDEVSERFRLAAAVHHRAFGTALEQFAWLRAAAMCAEKPAQRLRLMRARAALARQIGTSEALFVAYVDLAIAQFRIGARNAARASFQEAFRIHATQIGQSGTSFDYSDLSDRADGDFDNFLRVPAELGLRRELELIFAITVAGHIAQESYTNNAGLSWVAHTAYGLERYGLTELADDFYAFLRKAGGWLDDAGSEAETISAGEFVSQMMIYAFQLVDLQDYDTALVFLNRALGKVRGSQYPNETATVLTLLARTHNERGELDKAVDYAKRVVKLSQRYRIEPAILKTADIAGIIASASNTASSTDDVARTLLEDLTAGVAKICGETPDQTPAFPSLQIVRLANDEHLARSFLQGTAVADYLACFERMKPRLNGVSKPWADLVRPEHVTDVMFLLGIAGDRETAVRQLDFLFNAANWNVSKSDAELLAIMPDKYLRWEAGAKRMATARRFEEAARLSILAGAMKGLLLSEAGDWLRPYLAKLKIAIFAETPPAALTDLRIVPHLAEIGLYLHTMKETRSLGRLYDTVESWARSESQDASSRHHSCHEISVCEFLAVMEQDRGNSERAATHLDWIPNQFTVLHSGASVSSHEHDAIAEMALENGQVHERLNHLQLAEVYYRLAGASVDGILNSADPLRSFDDIRAADAFARIAYKAGRPAEARKITAHLVSAAQERISSLSTFGSDLLIRWSKRLRGIFETHLSTANVRPDGTVEAGEPEFLAMQYLQATRTAVTFTQLSARMGRDAGSAAREHQDVSAKLASAYGQLIGADTNTSKRVLRQIRSLEARSRKLEQALQEQNPAYFQHGRLQFITLEDLQGLLKPGEAVLSSYTGTDHAYLWLITRDAHRLQRLKLSPDELNRQVSGLRSGISADTATPDFIATQIVPVQLFHDMYRLVLGGFDEDLEAVDQLIFIPHGAFDGLPISTLLTEQPPEDSMHVADVRDAKLPWLIRRMAINVMPSPGSIRVLRSAAEQVPAERPFLGVGNPKFGEGLHIAAAPTRAADPRLVAMAPLPETETEVARLAEILDADAARDLLLDTAASETTLKQTALDDYRIIAFATHGLIAGEVTGLDEPALVLSKPEQPTPQDDGLLKASEVIDLKLNADLVMLSACNTASGDGRPGAEGLSGLANAFFYAGAKNLMVTHWYIPSEAAVDITVGLMQARRDDAELDWAQALRIAVLKLIDETGPARYANPLSWGAHMLVGVGR